MKLGTLDFTTIAGNYALVAESVQESIKQSKLSDVFVSVIDPNLSDTTAFCDQYQIGTDISANCVIVEARRADKTWYAACVILATDYIDVNGIVRRQLDARKISFAPMTKAVTMTGMEYGGITPIGLPGTWPLLIDSAVSNTEKVIIGSGIRKSKLLVPGRLLSNLPNALTLDITKRR